MERVLFKKEQQFTQRWLWLILIGSTLVSTIPLLYGIYSQEVLEKPWGNHPISTLGLVFFLFVEIVVMGGVILIFLKMRFKTEIKTDGIYFSYRPLMRKMQQILKDDIERFEITTYKPIAEYGGWGIKGRPGKKAYTVSGNTGLQIYLKNGKKILLGTQRKQAIEFAMKKLMQPEIKI